MKYKLISIFLILTFLSSVTLFYIEDYKIKQILNDKTKEFQILYEAVYSQYKEEAGLLYRLLIEKPEILNIYKKLQTASEKEKNELRLKLYKYLKNDYEKLRLSSLRQLHFHLKNNDSFLRMHRPEKYGDNLTKIRPTIAYVNKFHKKIDGFEEGRIFNGFRFVFPISLKNEHMGSVEISFSADAIIDKISSRFNRHSNLHISKKIVDEKVFKDEKNNYIPSPIEGYLIDKEVAQRSPIKNNDELYLKPVSKDTRKKIFNAVKEYKSVSFYDEKNNIIVSLLPIRNPLTKQTIAFITTKSDSVSIQIIKQQFYFSLFLMIILLLIILYFIYSQLRSKEILRQKLRQQKELLLYEQEQIKQKDKLIFQQSKMTSLGDMMENIAHQWRQPLSAISTHASGMEMELEHNMLKDERLKKGLKSIVEMSMNLSRTIDSFSNLFKPEQNKNLFNVEEIIEHAIQLIKTKLQNSSIDIIVDIEDSIQITTYKNEFIQILLNLFNNAKDVLEKTKSLEKKLIFVKAKKDKESLIISVYDNGNGIDEKIIEKIFEPYFTTKHKSQGTGLGLYMTEEIIAKHMQGTITVQNTTFIYEDNEYKGALFTIMLPL